MNRFPPNLGCGCFSSCSTDTCYPKHWNPKKFFVTSIVPLDRFDTSGHKVLMLHMHYLKRLHDEKLIQRGQHMQNEIVCWRQKQQIQRYNYRLHSKYDGKIALKAIFLFTTTLASCSIKAVNKIVSDGNQPTRQEINKIFCMKTNPWDSNHSFSINRNFSGHTPFPLKEFLIVFIVPYNPCKKVYEHWSVFNGRLVLPPPPTSLCIAEKFEKVIKVILTDVERGGRK